MKKEAEKQTFKKNLYQFMQHLNISVILVSSKNKEFWTFWVAETCIMAHRNVICPSNKFHYDKCPWMSQNIIQRWKLKKKMKQVFTL